MADLGEKLMRLLEPVKNRICMILSTAIVQLVKDNSDIQLLQVDLLKGETKDDVERFQNYGFTSVPRSGSQALVGFIAGNRDHGIAIAVDDGRVRLKLEEDGAVAVYDHDGNYVKLTASAGIEVNAPSKKVMIKAGGDIDIGNTALRKLVNDTFVALFNGHTHNYVPALHPATTVTPTGTPSDLMDSTHLTSKVKAE